jgi:hypothetical protein
MWSRSDKEQEARNYTCSKRELIEYTCRVVNKTQIAEIHVKEKGKKREGD